MLIFALYLTEAETNNQTDKAMSTAQAPEINTTETKDFQVVNTTQADWDKIAALFEKAIELQGKNGYKVWADIDRPALKSDIEKGLHYKITVGEYILCIFSVQYSDPLIWGAREKNDAIYLHRIVVNPDFKGQKQFAKVLEWAKQHALAKHLRFIRLDTWADNDRIIAYYQSFGFELLGDYTTPDSPELPIQNRNLHVALLEMKLA